MLKLALAPPGDLVVVEPGADDEPEADTAFVPLSSIASSWNALKLRGLSATALTAKTMPMPQWLAPVGVCCLH